MIEEKLLHQFPLGSKTQFLCWEVLAITLLSGLVAGSFCPDHQWDPVNFIAIVLKS